MLERAARVWELAPARGLGRCQWAATRQKDVRGAASRSAAVGCGARRTDPPSGAAARGVPRTHPTKGLTKGCLWGGSAPPNGTRLSCGRKARGRKVVEPQIKRLAGEATQFFPTGERPSASSAC